MTPGALLSRLEARAVARRFDGRSPLHELAALIEARGDDDRASAPRRLALCIELGLRARAEATCALLDVPPSPLVHLQLAWLRGDLPAVERWGGEPAQAAHLARVSAGEQAKCLAMVGAVSPEVAMDLVRRLPRPPLSAPAIALRAGDDGAYRSWRRRLPWRWHADYLLLDANLEREAAARLTHLNRYLSRHGLAPLALRDPRGPMAVANLSGSLRAEAPATAPVSISVVMPVHDNERHLGAALASIAAQRWRPSEVIVVDDASRDGSPQVLARAAEWLPELKVLRLPISSGAYVARNVGLAAARGEFVVFHDADDFSHPRRLAAQIGPMLREPGLVATSSRCVRLGDDGSFGEIRLWPLTRWTPISLALRRAPVMERIGAFEEVRYGADSEYAARLRTVFGRHRHRLVPQPLAIFAQRSGSLTTAGVTGFDRHGRSQDRIDYQESWTERHLACLLGGPGLYRPLPRHRSTLDSLI